LTIVKTRFESGRFQYRSVLEALTTIATTEGPRGEQNNTTLRAGFFCLQASAFMSLCPHTV
jgi:hypothetical protein